MQTDTIRTFAEDLGDSLINMLHNDAVIFADGTTWSHRGHGGMWNSDDCDRDVYTDTNGTIEVHMSSWIFPCEGRYDCPYLDTYAEGMADYIKDEDGNETDGWDCVACSFHVSVVINDTTCEVAVGIDNELDANRLVYETDFEHGHYGLNDTLIDHITMAAHRAMQNFDGTNPVIIS